MYKNFLLCLTLMIASFKGYRFECHLTEDQLDKCMLDTMFFGSEGIVPANDADMNTHCSTIKGGVACLLDFSNNCLTKFPQKVTGMILTNMESHMNKRCNNAKDRAEFIKNAQCFIPKEKMTPLNICSDKHTKFVEISSQMSSDDHIQGACCGYHLFKHCIISNTNSICGEGHAQYWDEIFDEVASEALTFACAEYDSKEKCAQLLKPESWAQFKAIDEATDPSVWHHGYKTPIKFILDMVKKFHTD